LLADKVAQWAIENLQRSNGYFCYQRRRLYRNCIPYMRWSQAWMAYGLARVDQVKRQK
jgi:hypothetical protein